MTPEAAEAIRIAEKYLPDEAPAVRRELALEIVTAIVVCAGRVAKEAIDEAFAKVKKP